MVGLIPLFAVETLEPELLERVPEFAARLEWFLDYRPDLAQLVSHWDQPGRGKRRLLSLLRGHRMKKLLLRMLDENEFLSDYGVRALSKVHEREPYVFKRGRLGSHGALRAGRVRLGLFGGNSNWRGPIWFPVNFLIIESLQKFHHYYGDDFRVECPTGSGQLRTIDQVADEIAHAAGAAVPQGRARPAAGARRSTRSCRAIRTSATTCCSTNTSTATPAAASAHLTRPAGPGWSRSC